MRKEIRDKLEEAGIVPPKEKPMAEQQAGIMFTPEMLENLIRQISASNLEAIRELKKPDPEEAEEKRLKKQREQANRVARVKEAQQYQQTQREVQFSCSHIKFSEGVVKQEHAFRGQVNNDNCCRPVCIRCNKLFPPFKVTDEQMKTGMALGNIKNLTAEALWHAHIKSFPNCKECAAGACAVRDLREKKQGHLDAPPEILPDGKVLVTSLTA